MLLVIPIQTSWLMALERFWMVLIFVWGLFVPCLAWTNSQNSYLVWPLKASWLVQSFTVSSQPLFGKDAFVLFHLSNNIWLCWGAEKDTQRRLPPPGIGRPRLTHSCPDPQFPILRYREDLEDDGVKSVAWMLRKWVCGSGVCFCGEVLGSFVFVVGFTGGLVMSEISEGFLLLRLVNDCPF